MGFYFMWVHLLGRIESMWKRFPMFIAYFKDKLLKLVRVVKLELLIPKFKETLWSSISLLESVVQH